MICRPSFTSCGRSLTLHELLAPDDRKTSSSNDLLLSILRRQEDCLDSRSEGPNQLLLNTADSSNTTAEGNFALDFVSCAGSKFKGPRRGNYRHGHRWRYGLAREKGNQGDRMCQTGGGAVLMDCEQS